MNLAFVLDEHWSTPEIVTPLSVVIPPIVATAGCYLVARRRQLVSYAIGLAIASAVLVFGGVWWMDVSLDVGAYPVDERLIVVYGSAFPFLAIGVFYWWPPTGGTKAPEPPAADRPGRHASRDAAH